MKIAISYPPLESSKGIPLLSQNRQFQWFSKPTYIYPMLPAYAATMLKKDGFEVIWDDGIAEGKSFSRWAGDIKRERPDMVVLESKTPVIKMQWEIIRKLKQIRDWQPIIVLVGDHVSALPEESLANSPVDYVLTGGDYDFLLLNLCRYLNGKQHHQLESGIYYREDGRIKNSGPFKLDHDLETLPMINRDLTRWQLYSEKNGNYKYLPGTYTMAGRDCWYHRCTFCSWSSNLYPQFRTRSPQSLLDEIGLLIDRYNVREIMDDTGVFPVGDWLKEFCEGMIARGYHKHVALDCNMRFGALSPEECRLMRKAGFRFILYGLESANQKTLDRINKGIRVEEIIESCKLASEAGLSPHITVMFGYPWEDEEDVQRTVKLGHYLMKKGYAHTLQATVVVPYPGTPLFAECQEKGWLVTTDSECYDMRQLVMYTQVGEKGIKRAVRRVYKAAFSPQFIWHRLITIRSWDDLRFLWRGSKKLVGHLIDFSPNKVVNQCLGKISLLKAGLFVFTGNMVGNLCNCLFQILMGRWLSLEDYGIMNSLISLFMITAIPSVTIAMVIAKYTSQFNAKQETDNISGIFYGFLKTILILASLGFLVFLLISPHISVYLKISSVIPTIIMGIGLFIAFLTPITLGVLQGLQHFRFLSLSIGLAGVLKLIFASILVYLGFRVNGVMTGLALSGVSIFWLTFFYLRRKRDIMPLSHAKLLKIKDKGEIIKYSLPVLGVTIIFSILTQADMVLVKHYFLAQQAGLYASAAVLGRAILYLPAAIIIALFPMVTELHSLNKDASHILKKGLVYTALLAGGGVLLFWIMPEFLLGFLFGQRYLAAAPLLGIFGLAMFPMAMLGILISFNLARNQVKLIYPLLTGAIIQITLIHFYHQTLNQVLWIIVGIGTLLFITNLGMILRDKDSSAD